MAFLQWLSDELFQWTSRRHGDPVVRDAIEQVVERIDPRLHLVKGYQNKLRASVVASLSYASELVDRLPPALELNSRTWNTDPAVHAFFTSIESLKHTVSRSEALRAFFQTPQGAAADEAYAVLSMTKRETKRFGTQLQGDAIQQEVLQIAVGFVDHVLDVPGTTEAEVRTALKQVAFEEILLHALDNIASMRTLKADLEKERVMLQMRYRLLQDKSSDNERVFGTTTKRGDDLEAIQVQLAENNRQLRKMIGFRTLQDYLERVKTILNRPEKYLSLAPTSVRLNRMNIIVKEGNPRGNDISLLEATVIHRPRRVVQLIKYPRKELLAQQDLLKMARRYLGQGRT